MKLSIPFISPSNTLNTNTSNFAISKGDETSDESDENDSGAEDSQGEPDVSEDIYSHCFSINAFE